MNMSCFLNHSVYYSHRSSNKKTDFILTKKQDCQSAILFFQEYDFLFCLYGNKGVVVDGSISSKEASCPVIKDVLAAAAVPAVSVGIELIIVIVIVQVFIVVVQIKIFVVI